MTEIYLIRHAEAEGNIYRRIHGHYDSLITPNGEKQIAALERRFADIPITACYASDLTRTRLTAGAICRPHHLTLITDPRFREVNMGVWEEVTFGEVAHTQPEQLNLFNNDPEHWAVEGCETFETYTGRFLTAMQEAAEAHPGETIAIVAHGGVIRGVLQRLFFHDHADQAGHCDNTGVALLRYENGQYSLVYHNDNSHLSDEISTLARQHWWRKDTGQSYDSNLWFRPMGDNREEYLKFRHDAWMTVYGNDDGYAGVAYWRDAQAEAADAPNALVEAVLGDQVVGMVQLAPQRFAELGVGYIPFLYLVESARGRELGAQLLGHAVGFYRPLGRTKLQLAASQANAPALHFYEKHGFTPVGSVPGVHGDLLLLEKNIDLGQYGL